MVGNLVAVRKPQEIAQRERVRATPGDAALAVYPLEIADHVHAEIPSRRQRRRAHPRRVVRLPQRGVTQGGRETFGEKGLSGLQAGHGALKVRALFGIVQDGGIAVTDPPQDGDDRVYIIGHVPADGITTPFCISLRSTAAVRGTSLSADNTNGDTMILARCCLDYPVGPHLDLPTSRKIVFVEKALRGTEPEQRQWHGSGVLTEVRSADIGNAVISAMDAKAVQMIVIPPHEDLDHPVQLGNR